MPNTEIVHMPTFSVTYHRQEGDGGESQLRMTIEKTAGFLTINVTNAGIETVFTPGEVVSVTVDAKPVIPPKTPPPTKVVVRVVLQPATTIEFDGDIFVIQTARWYYEDGTEWAATLFYDPATNYFFCRDPGSPTGWVSRLNEPDTVDNPFIGGWYPSGQPFPYHRPAGGAGGQQN